MSTPLRKGIALVVCAPSGTGKTTLIKRLVDEFPRFVFSVSCTTRAPRDGEVDGKDYHFITPEEFRKRKQDNYFAEWAEVYGNFYGTPLHLVQETLAQGRDVLFDIDVQGAAQLRNTIPEAHFVFILPPSRQELEHRLMSRRTETPDALQRRLDTAYSELRHAHWFNRWIVNDNLDRAWEEFKSVYIAATLSPKCQGAFMDSLLKQWVE